MAITPKGLKYLLVGLIVMISGYILMMGGGSDDPQVFNYAMFDFQRMVAAPVVIVLGIVIEVIAVYPNALSPIVSNLEFTLILTAARFVQ